MFRGRPIRLGQEAGIPTRVVTGPPLTVIPTVEPDARIFPPYDYDPTVRILPDFDLEPDVTVVQREEVPVTAILLGLGVIAAVALVAVVD